MRKSYKLLIFTILTALLTSIAFAGAGRGVSYNTMRNRAMGGVGIISAKGAPAFIINPALLNRGRVSVSPISLQFFFNNSFVDLGEFISDNADSLEFIGELSPSTLDTIYQDLNKIDNRWMKLGIPVSAAITVRNIGIAAYGDLDMELKIDKGIYEPHLFVRGKIDRVVTFGFGKGIDFVMPGLQAGAAVKFITRQEAKELKLGFSDIGGVDDAATDLRDSLSSAKTGFGIDIGGLYSLNDKIELGIVFADIIGSIDDDDDGSIDDDDDVSPNLKFGASYKLLNRVSAEINFLDLLNTDETNFFKRVHIGGEVDLPFLKIRGGFFQGYPSFGVGINLIIIQADFAVWTEEIGPIPGLDGETFYGAQINLGF